MLPQAAKDRKVEFLAWHILPSKIGILFIRREGEWILGQHPQIIPVMIVVVFRKRSMSYSSMYKTQFNSTNTEYFL